MSKQNVGKGNAAVQQGNNAKNAANRTAARSSATMTPAKKNGVAARQGIPAPPSAARTRTTGGRVVTPVKRKSGFRLRPLDIALLIIGVVVVGFIVASALHAPVQAVDPNAQLTGNGTPVPIGNAAPDFTLPGLDGQTYTLSSFKGHPVVLEFMATWCPHCQAESSTLHDLDAAYKAKGVQILAVNATPYNHNYEQTQSRDPATMDDLQWFHDNFNVTYPMLFDKTLKSANDYQVIGYPTIYIIDQNGKIAFQPTATEPDLATLSAPLDRLLAAK